MAPAPAMHFARTFDHDLVRSVICTPSIYRASSDDGSPVPEDYQFQMHPQVWCIAVHDGSEFLGLFILHPRNSTTWEIHTCLLPCAYGRAEHAAIGVFRWVWDNTACRRIVTTVPDFNRLALRLAHKACMIEFGIDTNSFLKGGRLWDEHLLGVDRPGEDSPCL